MNNVHCLSLHARARSNFWCRHRHSADSQWHAVNTRFRQSTSKLKVYFTYEYPLMVMATKSPVLSSGNLPSGPSTRPGIIKSIISDISFHQPLWIVYITCSVHQSTYNRSPGIQLWQHIWILPHGVHYDDQNVSMLYFDMWMKFTRWNGRHILQWYP